MNIVGNILTFLPFYLTLIGKCLMGLYVVILAIGFSGVFVFNILGNRINQFT